MKCCSGERDDVSAMLNGAMLNYSAGHSIDVDHIAAISTSSSSAVDTTHRNRQPGNVTVFIYQALDRPHQTTSRSPHIKQVCRRATVFTMPLDILQRVW
jgi:hypothetical protein